VASARLDGHGSSGPKNNRWRWPCSQLVHSIPGTATNPPPVAAAAASRSSRRVSGSPSSGRKPQWSWSVSAATSRPATSRAYASTSAGAPEPSLRAVWICRSAHRSRSAPALATRGFERAARAAGGGHHHAEALGARGEGDEREAARHAGPPGAVEPRRELEREVGVERTRPVADGVERGDPQGDGVPGGHRAGAGHRELGAGPGQRRHLEGPGDQRPHAVSVGVDPHEHGGGALGEAVGQAGPPERHPLAGLDPAVSHRGEQRPRPRPRDHPHPLRGRHLGVAGSPGLGGLRRRPAPEAAHDEVDGAPDLHAVGPGLPGHRQLERGARGHRRGGHRVDQPATAVPGVARRVPVGAELGVGLGPTVGWRRRRGRRGRRGRRPAGGEQERRHGPRVSGIVGPARSRADRGLRAPPRARTRRQRPGVGRHPTRRRAPTSR
jgi:hypothetical protein